MRKPDKPTNKLPESFGGIKENFSQDKISYGYQPDVPDILGGANLNYLLDTDGDNNRYFNAICDFITDMPIAKTITVNDNNELVYRDWLGGRNFGELVYSSIPLSDSGLKLLDGSLIQGSGIYKNFVDYIATIVNTYPSLFTTEENWQTTVSQYNVCGKYVYNSTNNTVRIPKVTGIVEGTVDVNALGNIVAAGLPLLTTNTGGNHTHSGTTSAGTPHSHTRGTMNITGTLGYQKEGSMYVDGCIYYGGDNARCGSFDGTVSTTPARFDASRSWTGSTSAESSHTHNYNIPSSGSHNHNITWGATTNTVQPQTVKMFVYVVVATGVNKTDIELDIDDIVTDLNYKADLDLSNLSETGQAKFDDLQDEIDTKVSKSGDTITGALMVEDIITNRSSDPLAYLYENTTVDFNILPMSTSYYGIVEMRDNLARRMGRLEYQRDADGAHSIGLIDKKDANTNSYSRLIVGWDANGNEFTQAPPCDSNDSIVTTVGKSKAANGYYKLGNGLIIQWGRTQMTMKQDNTVTFPTAFSSNNFSMTFTAERYSSTSSDYTDDTSFTFSSVSTTSVSVRAYDAGQDVYTTYVRWMAIGY